MFQTPIDICNRAMQHLGARRIDSILGFTEISAQASECSFAYDKLRRAELQSSYWGFAITRTVLRPMNSLSVQGTPFLTTNSVPSPTMLLSPALWSSTTTYSAGALVTDITGVIWQSRSPANAGFAPGNSVTWEQYTGSIAVDAWISGTSYTAGELAYIAPGDGTYTVYQSLVEGNSDTPNVASAWSATQVYAKDEVVTSNSVVYQSLVDLNYGHTPVSSPSQWTTTLTGGTSATSWRVIAAELKQFALVYPMGAGPSSQSWNRNAYRLPASFLRKAPTDPKQGSTSVMGAPANLSYDDYVFDGDFIVSSEAFPIMLRFVADMTNVARFDDMFCEALAARIAYEVCEPLTQSTAKQQACIQAYKEFMGRAKMVNAIEQGPVESPLDDFIACRS